jgi:hypothetical protein
MRLKAALLALALAMSAQAAKADEASGFVIATLPHCDYFIVESLMGYDLLEWFGGATPNRGDQVVGTFEEYGFHTIFDRTQGHSIRVWVEDYGDDSDEAHEKLYDHCD